MRGQLVRLGASWREMLARRGDKPYAQPVRTLLGEQWVSVVPILRILCLAAVLYPVHALNLQLLMAQGHARIMFRVEVAKKLLGLLLIWLTM